MRWGDARRSDNVEDRRGGIGVGHIGIGGIVIALLLSWATGTNPLQMLGLVSQVEQGISPPAATAPAGTNTPANDPAVDFVRAILGDTEDTWGAIFQKAGRNYTAPHLVLFSGSVQSACGGANAASGPFYCPEDQRVYLDLSFFQEMRAHLGGGGDFAQAYVIAHEVGHHVQNLLGISQKLSASHQDTSGAAGLSVRLELQADCLAGVWANQAQQRHQWLEQGDIEQALNTASAIGDDRLQQQTQGTVTPDSFTHGTSEQRVRWFHAGFDSGDLKRCDTFGAQAL